MTSTITTSKRNMEIVLSFFSQTLTVSCMRLKLKNFSETARDVEHKFDTSNFPKDHISGIPAGRNKKVVGMMKDEAGGNIIEEFVGLRAKISS